jgi:hypothetical protein
MKQETVRLTKEKAKKEPPQTRARATKIKKCWFFITIINKADLDGKY